MTRPFKDPYPLLALCEQCVHVFVGEVAGVTRSEHHRGTVADHREDIFVAQLIGLVVHEPALLNHQSVQAHLHLGALDDALLHSILRDEAEHAHFLRLSDTMSAIHRLEVHLSSTAIARSSTTLIQFNKHSTMQIFALEW